MRTKLDQIFGPLFLRAGYTKIRKPSVLCRPEDRVFAFVGKGLPSEIFPAIGAVVAADVGAEGTRGSAKIGRFGSTVVAFLGLGGLVFKAMASKEENDKRDDSALRKELRSKDATIELLGKQLVAAKQENAELSRKRSWF